MKILKVLLFLILLGLFLIIGVVTYAWNQRVALLIKVANHASSELFEGSLRLKSADTTKDLKIVITGLEGRMKTDTGSIPIKIERMMTKTSLLDIFQTRRSELGFENFEPVPSSGHPISGTLLLEFGDNPRATLQASPQHLSVEDYAWVNPDGFRGLSGFVSGSIRFQIDSQENSHFEIDFESEKQGGEVPAKFLEFALPYLPKAQNTKELKNLIATQKSMRYINGLIHAKTISPGKIQAQIKMLFPEQNLNLNLNLTILVDEEHAFLRAFKLLSLFKIKSEPTRLEAGK